MFSLHLKLISISLYLAIGTFLFFTSSSLVQSKDSQEEDIDSTSFVSAREDPYDFTGDGRSGRRTSGGSRGECPKIDPGLIALVPASNWGKTVSQYPTWWFYVPYSSEQAPVGMFILQDENYNDLYRKTLNLPSSAPGLVSVSLPKAENSIAVGDSYRWQLNLYCSEDRASAPVYVSGWIDRVSFPVTNSSEKVTPFNQHKIYANRGIWFDAINHLAQLRIANPSDASLNQDWQVLLQAQGVDLNKLINVPVAGNVEFTHNSDIVND